MDLPELSRLAGLGLSAVYLAAVALVCLYGLHRYWLVVLFRRARRAGSRGPRPLEHLPRVTVQLPMHNEREVAERAIRSACALDYPRDRLQVQVLDDSTDGSDRIARRVCEQLRREGHDVRLLHRTDRTGYKAGALEAGLGSATGELVAIFDADFIPPADFLLRAVHHFSDPGVGMVQTCWGHLNRGRSLLTRAQAIYLDAHFLVEHTARNGTGRWMNFNGTCGIWRRAAIDSAGGWSHDTLTEDMDLSYRAQLAGWRFVYRPDIACPGELPPTISAFKTQHHRWTKGAVQTALKLLRTILRSPAPRRVKVEAYFHLTAPIVYAYVAVIVLLHFPVHYLSGIGAGIGAWTSLAFGTGVLLLATVSGAVFYAAGQRARGGGVLRTVLYVPALIALGVGMCLSNAGAVLEACSGARANSSGHRSSTRWTDPAPTPPRHRRGDRSGAGGGAWPALPPGPGPPRAE